MKTKILQYVGGMNRAGAETLLMNIYRNTDREIYQFDFIYHTKEKCDYDDEILALGGRIIYLERPSIMNLNKYRSEFKNIVDEYGPYNTIHSHIQLMNGFVLDAASRANIKVRVSHSHLNGDYNKSNVIRNIYRKHAKSLIKKNSTNNLACSENAGKYLYDGRPFEVINNAVDLSSFNFRKEYDKYLNETLNIDNELKIITHIGRFVDAKNHKFIIEIMSELVKLDKGYRLVLCGDGPNRPDVEELIKTYGIEEYVYLLGIRSDINKILLSTDIFLMPSILEGLPVVLVEAQAAGCECVISKNIPNECDMHIGIVEFMSLEESATMWAKKIVTTKCEKIDFEIIRNKMQEANYDLLKNVEHLEEIYTTF